MPTKRQRELTAEAELRALQLIVGSMLSFAFIGTGDPEKEASRFAEAFQIIQMAKAPQFYQRTTDQRQ